MLALEKGIGLVKMQLSEKVLLFALLGTYGLFSTMMPQSVGWAEIIIGVLLLRIVSVEGAFRVIFPLGALRGARGWLSIARIATTTLFFVPLITALFQQNDFLDMARDVVALCFFAIPVAMFCKSDADSADKAWAKWLAYGLLAVGVSMSLRHFLDSGMSLDAVGSELVLSGGLPLVQDPSVQFALSFGFCMSMWFFIEGKIIRGLVMLVVAFVPLLAVLGAAARAPLGLTFLSIIMLYFVLLRIKKFPALVLLSITAITLYFSFDYLLSADLISGSIDYLNQKTENQGLLNSRDLEVNAVLEQTSSIGLVMFGHGWGGVISNPIVSGAYLRYVHNMFAYFYFKTGVLGFISFFYLICVVVIHYLSALRKSRGMDFVILISLSSPLLVGMLFEATYKTMLFGFILFMVISISNRYASHKK